MRDFFRMGKRPSLKASNRCIFELAYILIDVDKGVGGLDQRGILTRICDLVFRGGEQTTLSGVSQGRPIHGESGGSLVQGRLAFVGAGYPLRLVVESHY